MSASSQIVLIDDDRAWRETVSEYLQDHGFDVATADGPRRGQALLEQGDALVAVIDFQMPEMNGLELLRRVRRRRRDLGVLLVSSEEDPSLASRALAEGALAFLSKNAPPRLLLRKLLQLLVAALVEATMRRLLSRRGARLLPPPSRKPLPALPFHRSAGDPQNN
jgi:DNA-binding NtrC family response regulator